MLLATSEEEAAALRQRRDCLEAAGVEGAEVLTAAQVHQLEPSLATGAVHAGLLLPSDSQVNGKATAAALLRACEAHGPRFTALFHEAATQLVTGPTGRVEGVDTAARRCAELSRGRKQQQVCTDASCQQRRLHACCKQTVPCRGGFAAHPLRLLLPFSGRSVRAAHGVVVTLGAWSGGFLAQQLSDARWEAMFRPRRGLLLEMPRPQGMPAVRHGLMEASRVGCRKLGLPAQLVAWLNVGLRYSESVCAETLCKYVSCELMHCLHSLHCLSVCAAYRRWATPPTTHTAAPAAAASRRQTAAWTSPSRPPHRQLARCWWAAAASFAALGGRAKTRWWMPSCSGRRTLCRRWAQ